MTKIKKNNPRKSVLDLSTFNDALTDAVASYKKPSVLDRLNEIRPALIVAQIRIENGQMNYTALARVVSEITNNQFKPSADSLRKFCKYQLNISAAEREEAERAAGIVKTTPASVIQTANQNEAIETRSDAIESEPFIDEPRQFDGWSR